MKIKEKEFESILQDLKQLAQEMGAKVRFERGDFKGGYCLLRDDKTIVINKLSTLQKNNDPYHCLERSRHQRTLHST